MNCGRIISLGAKSIPLPGRRCSLWLKPNSLRMSKLRVEDKKQQQSQNELSASHAIFLPVVIFYLTAQ